MLVGGACRLHDDSVTHCPAIENDSEHTACALSVRRFFGGGERETNGLVTRVERREFTAADVRPATMGLLGILKRARGIDARDGDATHVRIDDTPGKPVIMTL